MTDEHVRELERRWRRSGEVEDEVRLVHARARSGATTLDRLALAAMLGSQVARDVSTLEAETPALPQDRPLSWDDLHEVESAWSKVFDAQDRLTKARFFLACTRTAGAALTRFDATDARVPRAIEAAERAVACPCDEHFAAAGEIGRRIEGERFTRAPGALPRHRSALLAAAWLCVVESTKALALEQPGRDRTQTCLNHLRHQFGAGRRGQERVMRALQRELIPWLLGHE